MKAVIQRVLSASVTVNNEVVSKIGKGLLVFAAVAPTDTPAEIASMAQKLLKIKMWDDDKGGRWKQSVTDIDGDVLLVSQFTLLATLKKGNKPDFHGSAAPEVAKPLYQEFHDSVAKLYKPEKVKDGVFGAMMEVALVNDGPVTFELEVHPPPKPHEKVVKPPKEKLPKGAWKAKQAASASASASVQPEEEPHLQVEHIPRFEREATPQADFHVDETPHEHFSRTVYYEEPLLPKASPVIGAVREDIVITAGGLDFEVETVDGDIYRTSAAREQMTEK